MCCRPTGRPSLLLLPTWKSFGGGQSWWQSIGDDLENQRLVLKEYPNGRDRDRQAAAALGPFQACLDTVWWRRVNYFVSLGFVLVAAAFPLLANYLRTGGVTESLDVTAGGSVGWAIESISGFLPRYVGPWITAVRQHPVAAAAVLVGLVLSLRFSAHFRGRISDRARAAWNVGSRVNRLKPTG
ncbi:MAG: hypothetical protein USCAAHI_00727 [Beijerinckiaceae bacterium]|nr:MAG: hypothetical protein USCAAHI_00727 [Beijerinckiaceae bacterium]